MLSDVKRALTLIFPLLLAACVGAPKTATPVVTRPAIPQAVPPSEAPPPPQQGFRAPEIMNAPGLEGVIRASGTQLLNMFGPPRLDVTEGDMKKLQFAGQACVLDVYLYPLQERGEPVATWVQARRASDGREVDRAACVNALRRR